MLAFQQLNVLTYNHNSEASIGTFELPEFCAKESRGINK